MPELSLFLPMLAMLLLIGAIAGVIAGLLGVGGGLILVPAFFYAFGALGYDSPQLMQICLATSLSTIVVTSVRSVLAHNRKGAVDWAILKTWAPGLVLGALVGVLVAAGLRSEVLQAIFGVLGVLAGGYLAFGRSGWRLAETMPGGTLRAALSSGVGFLAVLMGIGGGLFGVPLMTVYGQAIHRAVATAAGFGVLIALPSVIAFLLVDIPPAGRPPLTFGAVNLPAFAVIVGMTLLTTPLGVALAHRLDPKPLRRVFALFAIVVAGNMLRKAVGL
ncbi:sulfite exporter TauE/SafE family protein [Rhodovulum euryhalinum]|uniref:Probable membrane transporter protein n=1 Tax=Rhodovulum euryhalinum TaxID=35805 RepID=A0A4R2KJF8_9RHOB|nr:sulfite exporter TauE/SafE family protein [Rhodovulum euryhalinum]TCO72567.1 putative membrane protein YfcA [Rhodovulum euryhalinum]